MGYLRDRINLGEQYLLTIDILWLKLNGVVTDSHWKRCKNMPVGFTVSRISLIVCQPRIVSSNSYEMAGHSWLIENPVRGNSMLGYTIIKAWPLNSSHNDFCLSLLAIAVIFRSSTLTTAGLSTLHLHYQTAFSHNIKQV